MLTLALTGGIATGKSSFARVFMEMAPDVVLFDCDAVVQTLLVDRGVVGRIGEALGPGVVLADGGLDRAALRERVFGNDTQRVALEGILHPLVRERAMAAQSAAREEGKCKFFLADVPLLYETGFPLVRDLDLVVACSSRTQLLRLLARNGFSEDLARRILAAQLPIAEKMKRAHVVLWNGGSPGALRRQTESLTLWLKTKR